MFFRFQRTRQLNSITYFGLDEIEIVRAERATATLRPTTLPSTTTIQSVITPITSTSSTPISETTSPTSIYIDFHFIANYLLLNYRIFSATTKISPLEYICDFDVNNCGSILNIGVTQIGSDAFFDFVTTTMMSDVTVTDVTSISIYIKKERP